jgi:hypothetical protein
MHSHREARSGIGSTARRSALACGIALFTAGSLFWACGGTTGHPDDSAQTNGGPDSSVVGESHLDAGMNYDADLFDVNIPYANRPLPDTGAPGDGGAADGQGGSGGYPNCPPWLPVDGTGNVLDASDPATEVATVNFVPADYTADGGIEPAVVLTASGTVQYTADGGVEATASGAQCASYPWLPQFSTGCLVYQFAGSYSYPPEPPCNWAVGKAAAGPGAGSQRHDLCMNLYACIQASGCWRNMGTALAYCFYGDAGSVGANMSVPVLNGACTSEMQAAFEVPDLTKANVTSILNNFDVFYDPLYGTENHGTLTAPSYGPALNDLYYEGVTGGAHNCVITGGTSTTDAGAVTDSGAD